MIKIYVPVRVQDDSEMGFELWIDPGQASAQEIANFFIALSDLHRAHGGSGLHFEVRKSPDKSPSL